MKRGVPPIDDSSEFVLVGYVIEIDWLVSVFEVLLGRQRCPIIECAVGHRIRVVNIRCASLHFVEALGFNGHIRPVIARAEIVCPILEIITVLTILPPNAYLPPNKTRLHIIPPEAQRHIRYPVLDA
jgi:hypothetical protein